MKILNENVSNQILKNLKEIDSSININTLPKETDKTSFDGFDINKIAGTDKSYQIYREILNNPDKAKEYGFTKVYIAEMSPQEYMDLCSLYISHSETDLKILTDLNGLQRYFAQRSLEIAEKMKNGEKFALPILDFKNKEQDGRHRVAAAYINNYNTIPCLICY